MYSRYTMLSFLKRAMRTLRIIGGAGQVWIPGNGGHLQYVAYSISLE